MKNSFSIKRSSIFWLTAILLLASAALLYTFLFIDLLDDAETVGYGFQAIVQSDTMLFRDIFKNFNIGLYIDANVKNTILPVFMWTWIGGNWYISVIVNIAFLSGAVFYLRKIVEQLEIKVSNKLMLILFISPETFVYLIGILKEIPTLFFFSATTYFFLKKKWKTFLFFLLLLVLFRYQFVFCITLFAITYIFFRKNGIKYLFVIFFFLSATYPFWINNLQALGQEDAMLYREMGAGLGIGGLIQIIQSNVYGISFFATIVKFFQMMVEPWPALNLYDNNGVNIIALSYAITAAIWLSIWVRYFRNVFYAIRNPNVLTNNQNIVLCISFSFLIMVAFNSFVHHRYLYPGMGLVLLVASYPIEIQKNKI